VIIKRTSVCQNKRSEVIKTLVSIDFDFFVPELPEWDFGHRESLMFLKMLWASRVSLINKMKTDGNEVGFWEQFKNVKFDYFKWVSDSHSHAYNLLNGVSRVVMFDAHHDCWEADSLGIDKKDKNVYCDNWLRAWLEGGKGRNALWVKPGWQDACDLPKDMAKRVKVVTYSKGLDLVLEGSVELHICRSGCWVPPWLDKAFLAFLKASKKGLKDVRVLQDGEWNPIAERWSEKELEKIKAGEAQMQAKLHQMRVMTMKSGDFVHGMEEVRPKK
jgi:hypothetical protein